MSRLSAEKARDMARAKDPAFAVDTILAGIAIAAKGGKYEFDTREYGFGDGSCYSNQDKWPELCKAIIRELNALGYKCQVRCDEGQFVDMWLEVTWGTP
ncbi:hypothetical protein [Pseudomonas typographi]|uniref:hypothetical protein n=1 Tax=Pseudomonas typographi TaxID=2715964 RepID=UPI001681C566|nr:hypothetical protein [Pseudomonas typographi]MBD1554667.1 hypothetical protein [Pseudomonas typographi]